jgi:hypothetical protein
MTNNNRYRLINKALVALAAAIVLGVLTPAAGAQDLVVKTDNVKINFGTADFGLGASILGSPSNDGFVLWFFSSVNGSLQAKARVAGVLFMDSLDPGCVRLTIEFKSSSGAILATRNKDLCVTTTGHNANDPTNERDVLEDFANPDLNQVVLKTHSVLNNQIVSTSPAVTSTAPNIKKHDVSINGDNADFGKGPHLGGSPGSGLVQLTRDNGNLKGLVSGTLYYDSLFSEGCAQIIIDFENSAGSALKTETVKKCGPGGNANDAVNKKSVDETFSSSSLFKIRLRVGQVLPDGSFIRVKKKVCDFKECKDL